MHINIAVKYAMLKTSGADEAVGARTISNAPGGHVNW